MKRNRGFFMEGESKKFLLISICHAEVRSIYPRSPAHCGDRSIV